VPEPIMHEFEKMIATVKQRKSRKKGTSRAPRKSKKEGGKTSSRGTSVRGKK
jgi:hypothetical protein